MRNKLFTLFKICLSVFLLWFVFRDVNFNYLISRILASNLWLIAIYFLIWIFLMWLISWRWSMLVLDKGNFRQIKQFFWANLIACFYNLFLPTAYGGDLVKWTRIKIDVSKKKLLLSVLLDRVLGILGLILVGSIALALSHLYQLNNIPTQIIYIFIFLFLVLVVSLIILLTPIDFKQIPLLPKSDKLKQLEDYVETHRPAFLKGFLIAIIVQFLSYLSLYLLALATGLKIPFLIFFIISPIVFLITALPISFSGFGATEAAYLFFLLPMGINKEAILVFTSLFQISKLIMGVCGWLADLLNNQNKL